MTIVVAETLMDSMGETDEKVKEKLIFSMQKWGKKVSIRWIWENVLPLVESPPKPYGSNDYSAYWSELKSLFEGYTDKISP